MSECNINKEHLHNYISSDLPVFFRVNEEKPLHKISAMPLKYCTTVHATTSKVNSVIETDLFYTGTKPADKH